MRWGVIAVGLMVAPVRAEPPAECGLEDPVVALRAPAVPAKINEAAIADPPPPVRRVRPGLWSAVGRGAAGGALAGKAVYVSAGHGFTYLPGIGWRTQRPNTNGIVEDLVSTETVGQLLIQYLINMGAYVVPIRESDLNTNLAVVDDAGDGFAIEGGIEIGAEQSMGFAVLPAPLVGDENPFRAGGGRILTTAPAESGRARWTFDVPEDGYYVVHISYIQGPDRASDAHYVVRHGGGEAHFRVDQRRHGSTWMRLGRFYFYAGTDPERGAVELINDSADDGAVLSADAARIGGGMSVHDRGGGVSGRPMFETNARYNVQLLGAPNSVYNYTSTDRDDDVGARSRFAAWEHEAGEDAVYVAWHTNAPNPGLGTSTYTFGNGGGQAGFTGVAGSLALQNALHDELVGDLRAAWDPGWSDGGKQTAGFGEVNPNHNPEMPAVLVEVAFHDTPADAMALRDPGFRHLAARALAQGIARYFAGADGAPLTLPPEPPTAPSMVQADGGLVIAWQPAAADPAGGDPATGYRVYLSSDGLAFDDGHEVAGEQMAIEAEPGEVIYARITATNAGGESMPGEVVGARVSPAGRAPVLVVNGFDRADAAMLPVEDLSAYSLGMVNRGLLDRINDESYVRVHGAAIAAASVSFDSASAEAVIAGTVDLSRYQLIDWIAGEESSFDPPFGPAERSAITDFIDGGGALLASGSEIGWALDAQGDPEEQAFFREILGAVYITDDAETYSAAAVAGPFADLGELTFDELYDADYPDVLAPAGSGVEVLAYSGPIGGGAAVLQPGRVLIFGFPFETIAGGDTRAALMQRSLDELGVEADVAPDDVDPGELESGCGCASSGGPASGALALLLGFIGLRRARRRATPGALR